MTVDHGSMWKHDADRSVDLVQVNGGPGSLVRVNREIDGVLAVRLEAPGME